MLETRSSPHSGQRPRTQSGWGRPSVVSGAGLTAVTPVISPFSNGSVPPFFRAAAIFDRLTVGVLLIVFSRQNLCSFGVDTPVQRRTRKTISVIVQCFWRKP